MKTPTEFQISQLSHVYDPAKAHAYYLRTRKLKGRESGKSVQTSKSSGFEVEKPKRTRAQISKGAKARQRKELAAAINNMELKLKKLEALIRKKQSEEASENREAKAKKERAAKEKDKPKSAAEKAEIARENKKYREKNQQKLKNKSSDSSGGGSSSKTKKASKSGPSVSDLKSLATRVRGQIAVAKQKLAAL